MTKLFLRLFFMLALAPAAIASEQVVITDYMADPMLLLDADAGIVGELPVADMPPLTLKVEQYNSDLELLQITLLDGSLVWLDEIDVTLSHGKTVALPCEVVAIAAPEDQDNNSTLGFGNGCADSDK